MNLKRNEEQITENQLFATHNLEVPGSSPGWSTLKSSTYKNFVGAFSFIGDPQVTFFWLSLKTWGN